MKNIIKIIIAASLSFSLLHSCIDDLKYGNDALEKPLGTELVLDSIFSRASYAERFVWSLYHYVPNPASFKDGPEWHEALSDCIHGLCDWGLANQAWYSGGASPTSGGNRWEIGGIYGPMGPTGPRPYEGIRIAHILLENIDRVPDMSDALKRRYKAEAKVIMAGKYWETWRHFGGIPIVEKALAADDQTFRPRASIEEIYNHMIGLLDEAIEEPNLPWALPAEEMEEFWGRVTKAAAVGQKMLIQLHAASPLFNNAQPYYTKDMSHPAIENRYVWWGSYKPELWEDLRKTCEFFISENEKNGNPYQLLMPTGNTEADYMSNYRNAYWNRGAVNGVQELVYVSLPFGTYTMGWWDNTWIGASNTWGGHAPTAEFMEMFSWADGAPFDTTGLYTYNVNPVVTAEQTVVPANVAGKKWRNIYDGRDPRLYETLIVQKQGYIWGSGKQLDILPNGNYKTQPDDGGQPTQLPFSHGIGHTKWFINFNRQLATQRPYSWPVFRMGAFHLIYAEALAETGNLNLAAAEINKVRSRVGMGAIESFIPEVLSDKDKMIKEILRERACELGYEDTRFMDMVRRKLEYDFRKPLHGIYTYRTDGKNLISEDEPYPADGFWYDRRQITYKKPRIWWNTNPDYEWDNKLYLTYFSMTEILKNYGLVQNPGW